MNDIIVVIVIFLGKGVISIIKISGYNVLNIFK